MSQGSYLCKKPQYEGQTQKAGEKTQELVRERWVARPKAGKGDTETVKGLDEVAQGRWAGASKGAFDGVSVSESAASKLTGGLAGCVLQGWIPPDSGSTTNKLRNFADFFLRALVVASAALHWSSAQVPWELPH